MWHFLVGRAVGGGSAGMLGCWVDWASSLSICQDLSLHVAFPYVLSRSVGSLLTWGSELLRAQRWKLIGLLKPYAQNWHNVTSSAACWLCVSQDQPRF